MAWLIFCFQNNVLRFVFFPAFKCRPAVGKQREFMLSARFGHRHYFCKVPGYQFWKRERMIGAPGNLTLMLCYTL